MKRPTKALTVLSFNVTAAKDLGIKAAK